MSEFDKEKEREKLREKYERDEEKRETAEKMSELLLQGATMTNAHCSECGDPIFRYEGQEFCATCEQPVDRQGNEEADDADEDEAGDQQIEVTSPSDDARVAFGGQAEQESADTQQAREVQQADEGQSPERTQAGQPTRQQTPPAQGRTPAQGGNQQQARQQTREVPSIEPSGEDGVAGARASLIRTLTRFSQQAEAAEDPQRAREYLQAAREAAETLSALRQ